MRSRRRNLVWPAMGMAAAMLPVALMQEADAEEPRLVPFEPGSSSTTMNSDAVPDAAPGVSFLPPVEDILETSGQLTFLGIRQEVDKSEPDVGPTEATGLASARESYGLAPMIAEITLALDHPDKPESNPFDWSLTVPLLPAEVALVQAQLADQTALINALPSLRQALGDLYTYAKIDHKSGGAVTLYSTEPTEAESIVRAFGLAVGRLEILHAKWSDRQGEALMTAATEGLIPYFNDLGGNEVVAVAYDAVVGAVVIRISGTDATAANAALRQLAQIPAMMNIPFQLGLADGQSLEAAGNRHDGPPVYGAHWVDGNSCSVGFKAQRGYPYWDIGYITAGHCVSAADAVNAQPWTSEGRGVGFARLSSATGCSTSRTDQSFVGTTDVLNKVRWYKYVTGVGLQDALYNVPTNFVFGGAPGGTNVQASLGNLSANPGHPDGDQYPGVPGRGTATWTVSSDPSDTNFNTPSQGGCPAYYSHNQSRAFQPNFGRGGDSGSPIWVWDSGMAKPVGIYHGWVDAQDTWSYINDGLDELGLFLPAS